MNHMRVLRPAEGVYAFYDGRIEGYRFADEPNWVDEGAIALGIASYAVVFGEEALVYDTHTSIEHARDVRNALEGEGVRRFTVVLSHWHLDHVAGTEVFGDCEVISSERTLERLARHRAEIERGTMEGPPGIDPLILPTRTYSERLELTVGGRAVELIHTDIHSDDATMVWLADRRLLLCGDTMEDTVTYVDEPGAFRCSPGEPGQGARTGAGANPAESWLSRRDRLGWLFDGTDLRDRGLHPHAAASS